VQNLEKKIALLENQVKYYKFAHGLILVFIAHVRRSDSNAQVKRDFYAKVFTGTRFTTTHFV
jgi:hypothetical protein